MQNSSFVIPNSSFLLTHRDLTVRAYGRVLGGLAVGPGVEHADVLPLPLRAEEVPHWVVQLEAPFVVKHQQAHGDRWLGHRVQAEDIVVLDGHLALRVGVARGLGVGDFAVARDDADRHG